MDRLICGDVGFGKTEIAMRAAFKAVQQEKQVAVLVPTTILAQQHFETFCRRFEDTPFIIEVISRFRTAAEQKKIIKRLQEGKIDVLIGTHRMLSTDVKFKELGLLVVDEELLEEEGEFVLDEVRYQIVRIINEDVEHPLVYVVVLDILSQI